MPANGDPIYTVKPDVSVNNGTGMGPDLLLAANDYTGISANYALEHTAGANGSYIRKLRFKPKGTNVTTVARIFINNGLTPATASNNSFFGEITLPLTTANAAAASYDIEYNMEIALPPGFRIYCGLGTAVAAGWNCMAIAGQY